MENMKDIVNIVKQDITKLKVDIIVNAANTSLLGGGGVDGAIHRAAGPELYHKCLSLGGCKTGEAKITEGYNLPCKYIIHTPGPVYKNGEYGEAEDLKTCYLNSMILAKKHEAKSIAFPAISTGVYNFPVTEAGLIAINTVVKYMRENDFFPKIYFTLIDDKNYNAYNQIINDMENF